MILGSFNPYNATGKKKHSSGHTTTKGLVENTLKKKNTELTKQKECVSGLREYTYEETVTCVEETVANEELG